MLAVLSEFERDVISERTSMAMAHLRSTGKYTGGFEPYGSRCVAGCLEVIPEELRVIKVIHQLRNEGVSLRGISKRLAEISVTTRTGKAFLPIQIDRILKASPPGMNPELALMRIWGLGSDILEKVVNPGLVMGQHLRN